MKKLISIFIAVLSLNAFAWQPEHPIRLYVGGPPGGAGDNMARVVAAGFAKRNINVIVVNKPGANGAIAAREVAQAKPDGYTLLTMQSTTVTAELMRLHSDGYSSMNSFEHLAVIGLFDSYIFANPKTVEGGIEQVIEDIRAGRKKYSWAVTYAGSMIFVKQIEERLGQPITIASYQGRPPAMSDFLGGHVDILVDSGTRLADIDERVKLLTSSNRNLTPNHSFDKVFPGITLPTWTGISMPAGASPEVVKYYQDTLTEIIRDVDTQEKLKQFMVRPTNESLKNLVANNIKNVKPIADKLNRN